MTRRMPAVARKYHAQIDYDPNIEVERAPG
jgi:hypothetical protein